MEASKYDTLRVVLMGKTGAGKSSLDNSLICRSKQKQCEKSLHTVQVMDTPGLCDTCLPDENIYKEIAMTVALADYGPHVIIFTLRCDCRFTAEKYQAYQVIQNLFSGKMNHLLIVFNGLDNDDDNDEEMHLHLPTPRITRQPETIYQDEIRRLYAVFCGEATSNHPHSMQFSLHIGDKRIKDGSYRKAAGIDDGRSTLLAKTILYMSNMSTPYGLEDDIKLSVKLNLKGENKDYWTHSLTANGEVALPEKQRMYLSQPLRQLQSRGKCFPVSVHWVLETTENSPQDLEAEVQLFDVTDNNSHDQVVASLSTENAA